MGVALQTEFNLMLPHGYVDTDGNLHREVTMRMATGYDEIAPLKDPRVQSNPGYLVVILLSRVVTRLGTIDDVNPRMIEQLFAGDLAYLQEQYERINETGHRRIAVECPHCGGDFEVEMSELGE